MKKIPTLYLRDPQQRQYVTTHANPECTWVLKGEGVATRKYDGTCVMYDGEEWWARREVKPGKVSPARWMHVESDTTTGKNMGWEPAEQSSFHACLIEAFEREQRAKPGTYELCGPKINGNPEAFPHHVLITHGAEVVDVRRTYDDLAAFCYVRPHWEGLVFHHPDGRVAKIKRKDFR